ncbi:protein of unknown function [Taphrina deformans PYCC 5710]|uniref:Spherulin 4-like cell surface protein n=1 Tax=Taphrina deformans (strain PYCC 5710 / ATCC 11124 / CBS 356.35 / IMI 108563 / JCM 9778 / NBRC 8474) TaxID=1097556 RepID=R4XLH6_TAPDE|nr:protein of unknown function [Taphrina deformans PYCC 5710]|eukprot:CCG84135.1 protein of unknown function [Taphrina deformans PYCC 5710]
MKLSLALLTTTLITILQTSLVASAPSQAVADSLSRLPTPISRVPIEQIAVDTALEKRSSATAKTAILLPAYIYPSSWTSPPAWQPIYDAAAAYPGVTFHVIINPNSGPGGASPDSEYQTAITTLKRFSNVVLLGYVHTSWGTRSSDAVYADIKTYVGWKSQGYGMQGIFYDEAPSQATSTLYNYMANITCYAKEQILATGIGLPTIYFNPGTVADVRYYTLADYISVFEDTYTSYLTNEPTFAPGTELTMSNSNFMIHSMNGGWTQAQMSSFISSLSNGDGVGSVFLTSNSDPSNPYGTFGADWTEFVAGVDALRH